MKVFVCFTPLHVLISKRIIFEEGIEDYFCFYLGLNKNKKNLFYYEKLSAKSIRSKFISIGRKNILSILLLMFEGLVLRLRCDNNLIFYTGNIKKMHSRFLMFLSGYKSIVTFDDGVGNLVSDGYFSSDERIFFKWFFLIFNSQLTYKYIIENIDKHYTIYDFKNIFKNTVKIILFKDNINRQSGEKIVVLVTSPFAFFDMMSKSNEINLYDRLIKDYNVDFIINHPLDSKEYLYDGCKVINSKFIAEELVFKLLQKNDVTVIGTYSSVLLNLSSVHGVNVVNVPVKLKRDVSELDLIFDKL